MKNRKKRSLFKARKSGPFKKVSRGHSAYMQEQMLLRAMARGGRMLKGVRS
ncbi:hypothetical protein AtDm6_1282 [Acetobacter tropicalis]|uniref:Uncharacterized protein n=1 Tax=Acetobacter tropicalis TaxID=104102 RepID=A0A094YUM4_9PROT|nr:hypothetical protein [Acetobacter tropicalis]KGB24284.1 hypothetical protein AtDm6_1282 [Acetobacter tropicalis]MDO8172361.1 hypothetical protein [Acetobacter tropicalis]